MYRIVLCSPVISKIKYCWYRNSKTAMRKNKGKTKKKIRFLQIFYRIPFFFPSPPSLFFLFYEIIIFHTKNKPDCNPL